MQCHDKLCRECVMLCRECVMSCRVMSCYVMSYYVLLCHVVSCHVMLYYLNKCNCPIKANTKLHLTKYVLVHWYLVSYHMDSYMSYLVEINCIIHPSVPRQPSHPSFLHFFRFNDFHLKLRSFHFIFSGRYKIMQVSEIASMLSPKNLFQSLILLVLLFSGAFILWLVERDILCCSDGRFGQFSLSFC